MRIQFGGTHITNNVYVDNSHHAALTFQSTPPAPQRPPESTNWAFGLVKALVALGTLAKALTALAPYAAQLMGG
ncbi:hypothetical protein [Stenotrophomonas sp. 22385]|jgi:hypothetical protein|uniref:hypothetical protein n=1 Tax=Stenotrophomonas sp. 22385 TaxID=3453915 RepID=UPI003F828192